MVGEAQVYSGFKTSFRGNSNPGLSTMKKPINSEVRMPDVLREENGEHPGKKLFQIAESLAEEIRQGVWDNRFDPTLPITRSTVLIAELEKRSPGFDAQDYRNALARGMQNTR
jgi:hypothetical protein